MITIATGALDSFADDVRRFGEGSRHAAAMAINDTLRWTRTRIQTQMQQQVSIKLSTLRKGRLFGLGFANADDLQGVLAVSKQPFSLGRFAVDPLEARMRSPRVQVRTGGPIKTINRGFVLPMGRGKGGSTLQMGIAIRTKGGLQNGKGRQIAKDLYVLFGPSPDQLMRRMAPEAVPDVVARLTIEYARQRNRIISGLTNG